jgi:hypothetical protein
MNFQLRKNNSEQTGTRTYTEVDQALDGGYYGEAMSTIMELAPADVLKIYGTGTIYGQAAPYSLSWFSGYRIGA